jgi:predicted flavoprotein YhiN
MKWFDLSKKNLNQLLNTLLNDIYEVSGKTTFKEEFVTCGGVKLSEIDMTSMESKALKNLYFAGEVMDVDGITGGFNFQAAWTTGYIAGQLK